MVSSFTVNILIHKSPSSKELEAAHTEAGLHS